LKKGRDLLGASKQELANPADMEAKAPAPVFLRNLMSGIRSEDLKQMH